MSAAAYYNLTTYRPDAIDVAIKRKAKVSTMPNWPELSVYYYADDRFEIGIQTVQEGKNQFKIYDIEKTEYSRAVGSSSIIRFCSWNYTKTIV